MIHPFGYRDAAKFWAVADNPALAMQLHALVGGTPAYRDMCNQTQPTSSADLNGWVARNLLDPASAMFREGNVLLSEQEHVSDTAVYFSVLTAISSGRTRRGEIATAIGKTEGALTHPLSVLTAAGLVDALDDAVKQKRTTYHLAEPVLRLHQLVIAPNESRLTRHHGTTVWTEAADTVASRIYGPHFEQLARTWCIEHASNATLGGVASRAAPSQISCRQHNSNHEIDVIVTEVRANTADRIIAIGEAKWRSTPCGVDQVERLDHLRELLKAAPHAKLLVFSRSGFTEALTAAAGARDNIELIDVERLYTSD
jgi:DNA-binding transcriptional ArsR family regulator